MTCIGPSYGWHVSPTGAGKRHPRLVMPDEGFATVCSRRPLRLRRLSGSACNAVKFTAAGHITFRAGVGIHRNQPSLDFEVSDTGIGIESAALEKLFQPLSQADSSTTRRFGGTGLGLMIVRELLDNMGGEIRVESHIGHGSSFYFWIPLVEASYADEERQERSVFLNLHRRRQ